ncbi:MAG: DEAD/DEAH box helicase [Pseudomonadales bacterium]|nr:DEAD/DEAH box helicase [Pseudomonadales bacterium]MBO6563547.1 DEAD/DEAH box helicase [Pseudomonadales bacterium]MBO6594336.1 DEAD/DEAH box helicase [Pseudomonadales bacterium]MBO6657486.1 DEAD/DEAH box helicase [Pseudomonadales bacterium]MBO6700837.1 DEAD/DEAH box helicase [Pseudomonadales bacterium]
MTDLPDDFEKLDLPEELEDAILDLGFSSATPVQNEVLPHSLDGRDIIAQAQTGTGKTAAFLISILAYELENPRLEERDPGTPFALIIAPTRELVMQIKADADALTKYTDIEVVCLVGGIDYERQKKQLKNPVDVVVATPGRLLDFARSGTVDLSEVEIMVIDEADRMLSMGFIPDVKSIVARTPKKQSRQTQLFSATYSEDIKRLAASWTLDPVRIEIEPEQVAVDTVEQKVFLTSEDEKYKVLYNIIHHYHIARVLIFVNRRDESRDLESKLDRHGFKTGLLAGDVPQKKRIRTLERFRSGEVDVLVATDVAGRGLHIDDISHVINFNLPEDPEDYVHRIGRTGRAGSEGMSISLACESDAFMLPNIEALLGSSLPCENPPEELTADIPDLPPGSPPPRRNRNRRRR